MDALAGVKSVLVQLERRIVEIAWGDGFVGVEAVQGAALAASRND